MAVKFSLSKALSGLITTGRGDRVEALLGTLHAKMIAIDPITGINRTDLFKNKQGTKADQNRIGVELYKTLEPYLKDLFAQTPKSKSN